MLVERAAEEEIVVVFQLNTRSNIKVTKPQTFNKKISKVLGFLMTYRLYIRMKMRNMLVKE